MTMNYKKPRNLLLAAANLIDKNGLTKRTTFSNGRYCIYGAIFKVQYGNPKWEYSNPNWVLDVGVTEKAIKMVERHAQHLGFMNIAAFNDDPKIRKSHVVMLLRCAAEAFGRG